MQKVRVIAACKRKVVRNRVALILSSAENFEVVGRKGADVLEEVAELQPDLLVYELCSIDDSEYEVLRKLRELCGWTKIIVVNAYPVKKEIREKFLGICDGYLQEPILPGFLLKALELACYSGHSFFLGSLRDIKAEMKEEEQNVLPVDFSSKH